MDPRAQVIEDVYRRRYVAFRNALATVTGSEETEPIDAGFFSYDIPDRYQTEANHLVAVDALDANGSVVKEQPLH